MDSMGRNRWTGLGALPVLGACTTRAAGGAQGGVDAAPVWRE